MRWPKLATWIATTSFTRYALTCCAESDPRRKLLNRIFGHSSWPSTTASADSLSGGCAKVNCSKRQGLEVRQNRLKEEVMKATNAMKVSDQKRRLQAPLNTPTDLKAGA